MSGGGGRVGGNGRLCSGGVQIVFSAIMMGFTRNNFQLNPWIGLEN